MNHNIRVNVVLCGLVLFLITMPAVASAETDTVLNCITKYQQMGKTYDEAKMICASLVTPAAVPTTVQQTQTPVQYLPDLVVKEIYCAPGNKLAFNVENRLTPIPSGWMAVADVYIDGVKKGSIDLGRPTGGDLTVGGASYLTSFDISGTAEVKVVADPTNSIKETDETNNANVAKVVCQSGTSPAAAVTVDPVAECIAKNQQLNGMSYDEAKKYCTIPTVTSLSPLEGCIKKYMDVFGISSDEAGKLCAGSKTQSNVNEMINRCGELEKKLNVLIDRLKTAQGQDAGNIVKDILALKKELLTCRAKAPVVTKVVTPGIKNPCDELAMLKDSLAQIEKKMMYLRELNANTTGYGYLDQAGTSGYGYLDIYDYSKEYNYLKERLARMSFACQQGKSPEESPCARLSKLELIYREINDKLAGADDKTAAILKDKLASVVKEIEVLKQKCRSERLDSEKVETLYDLEEAYRAKQKAIVEDASDADIQGELARAEDEKKKLLEDFAGRMSEIDARQSTIILKLKIKDGNIVLDDLKTKARKLKLDVKEKEIEIESQDDGTSITDGNTTAKGDVPLEYSDGALISTRSGKEIKMMPGSLIRDIEGMDYVKIDDDITWFPITIVFQTTQLSPQPDPPGVTLPAGTKGEKIGAGHYKFLLPDGKTVDLSNYDGKTRTGDVSISEKDGTAGASGTKATITGAPKPKKSGAAISPSGLKELILKDDGIKPEYLAKVEKKGRILGIIPTTVLTELRINAQTGDVAGTSSPWWSMMAIIDPSPPD